MAMMLTEEQQMLNDALARLLEKHGPGAAGDAPWRDMAETLGLMGLGIPEDKGGLGGGAIDAGVVMMALGRAHVVVPWIENWAAAGLLARANGPEALLQAVTSGAARLALAAAIPFAGAAFRAGAGGAVSGELAMVAGAASATHLLIPAEGADGLSIRLVAADAAGVTRTVRRLVDGSDAADIRLDAVADTSAPVIAGADAADALIQWATDAIVAGRAAEAIGLCQTMMADTVDYARTRRQFGVAIGTFQVLRHRMVDMQMALDRAEGVVENALETLGGDAADRARMVSAAKHLGDEAARIVGEGAVQIHGGMGVTQELRVGNYFRRARLLIQASGGTAAHLRRYAAA